MEEIEAKAILEGIDLAVEMGWQTVTIESNNEVVINQLKGADSMWIIYSIVANIIALARTIGNVSWEVIPRMTNQCADYIVNLASRRVCPLGWVSQLPPDLCCLLLLENSM